MVRVREAVSLEDQTLLAAPVAFLLQLTFLGAVSAVLLLASAFVFPPPLPPFVAERALKSQLALWL